MSDALSRVVSELDAHLTGRAKGSDSPSATLERSVTDIVWSAGWKKRSAGRMKRLREKLEARGVRCSVDLTDLRVPAKTVVRFSRVPDVERLAAHEPSPGGRRVFLSYGRRDATALADRLYSELKHRSFYPWKDTFEIRGGSEWDNAIRAGIEGSEALIAVLSPASVRTARTSPVPGDSDSVCLDEIGYARMKIPPTPIVPVMGVTCQLPVLLSRFDYVDLTGWKDPGFDWKSRMKRLFDGLEGVRNGEDFFWAAVNRLKPWDFEHFIERKRQNFFGRGWLFDSILTKLEATASLLVIGDPGIGKTAAMAEFVHRNFDGRIDAYHFCRAERKKTLEPGLFVRSIAAMLASRHPQYKARLEAGEFWDVLRESESDADPRTALESGVLDPLNEIDPPDDGFRVMVVDSLDEALRIDQYTDRAGGDPSGLTIVELLGEQLELFPQWLRLLATTRSESGVLDPLLGVLEEKRLDADGQDNVDDIRKFIEHRTASGILHDKIVRGSRSFGVDMIRKIAEAAGGNFLYASLALNAIEKGHLGVSATVKLPVGLPEHYRRFFMRRYRSDDGFQRVRPVLECIVAGQAPVPESDLALATDLDIEYDLPGRLEELSEFLRMKETTSGTRRFSIFHKSLTDWLVDPERRGKAFHVSEQNGHRGLAEALWKVYTSNPCKLSEYGLAYISDHLAVLARSGLVHAADPGYADRLVRYALDDQVQDLRTGDPQGIRRSIGGALRVAADAPALETTPGAIAAAIGLPVFNSQRLDPERPFELADSGDLERLRSELDLYPVDATWRGAILVTLAWRQVTRDNRKSRALRDEANREISESEKELQRIDEYLSTGTIGDQIAHAPSETRILALLAQVGGTQVGEHIAEDIEHVAEELHYRQSEVPPTMRHVSEGVRGRRASHAELFAPEIVAFAARQPDPGDGYVDDYIERHSQNTYRHYRRSALRFILHAVLDHPDPAWIADRLKKIIIAELSASTPEFTECATAALASIRNPVDFEKYVNKARQAAAVLPRNPERGEGDTWGSHKRRLAAAAEATARGLGNRDTAWQLLRDALNIPYGFAGFQAPACLTLAESILVVGGDSQTMIEDALSAARTAAHNIFELTFAIKMTSRCNAIIEDWWPGPTNVADVIERFSADPSRHEFAPMHIVGWEFEGRRKDTESLSDELKMTEPSLDDLARVYHQPVGEFRRLNPNLSRSDGLPSKTRVRVPDPEFPPILAGRLAAEALVSLTDSRERVLAVRRLLPIAAENVTELDVVIGRLILAIAPLPEGPGILDEIRAELVRWVPRLPEPKASARELLKAMA